MAILNDNHEIHAGDTRAIRLRVRDEDAAKLDLAPGDNEGVHIEWWLADNSAPTVEQVRVRITQDEGVALVQDGGKWFVEIQLREEYTGALPTPRDYYHEARITDAENEDVLVTATGVIKVRRSAIAGSLLGGAVVPPDPVGSPTLAAVARAETAAESAEADAAQAAEDRAFIAGQIPTVLNARDVAVEKAGEAAADAVQTAADRIATNADAASTAADRQAVALDKADVASDRQAVAALRLLTEADAQATGLDALATSSDRAAVAGDRVIVEAARDAADADAQQVAADRLQTGQDAQATAADRIAVAADRAATQDAAQIGIDAAAASVTARDAAQGFAQDAQSDAAAISGQIELVAGFLDQVQSSLEVIDGVESEVVAAGDVKIAEIEAQGAVIVNAAEGYALAGEAYLNSTSDFALAAASSALTAQIVTGYADAANRAEAAAASAYAVTGLSDLSRVARSIALATDVVAVFVYDTTKDTDGGAWRQKVAHTSWMTEALGTAIRGTRAEFPSKALVVLRWASSAGTVTIYDLDDPSCPMWMVFTASGNPGLTPSTSLYVPASSTLIGAHGAQGRLYLATGSGLVWVDFIEDKGGIVRRSADINKGVYSQNIVARNSVVLANDDGVYIPNFTINAVAATVLPHTPRNALRCDLPNPTVAVATGGGCSIIRWDGVACNSSVTSAVSHVGFMSDGSLFIRSTNSNCIVAPSAYQVPSWTGVGLGALSIGGVGSAYHLRWSQNPGQNASLINVSGRRAVAGNNSGAGMFIVEPDRANLSNSLAAYITDKFNTGFMPGSCQLALAESSAELSNIVDTPVVTEDFDYADQAAMVAAGWSAPSLGGTFTFPTPGVLRFNASGAFEGTTRQVSNSLVIGKAYQATINVAGTGGGGDAGFFLGTNVNGSQYLSLTGGYASGVRNYQFIATSANLWFTIQSRTSGGWVEFNSIVLTEVAHDRRGLGNTLNGFIPVRATGTITRSPVASGAEQAAYSGFSAANYLRAPYNAAFDFGTGAWSASSWVNIPSVLPLANFPLGTNIVTDFEAQFTTRNVNSGLVSKTPTAITVQSLASGTFGVMSSGLSSVIGKPHLIDMTLECNFSRTFSVAFGQGYVNVTLIANVPQTVSILSTSISTAGFDLFASASGAGEIVTVSNITIKEAFPAGITERAAASGPRVMLGVNAGGRLVASVFDGTTTRTVTTTAAYNNAQWLKAEATYETNGRLSIYVNGVRVASATGTPLLTLNNASAVLTIGNSFAADAPFPGSIALTKINSLAPLPDQIAAMYAAEAPMFQPNSKCLLLGSASVNSLAHDPETDRVYVAMPVGTNVLNGLLRTGYVQSTLAANRVNAEATISMANGVVVREATGGPANWGVDRNRWSMTENAATGAHQANLPIPMLTAATWVFGVPVLAGSRPWVRLQLGGGANPTVDFDLSNGSAGTVLGGATVLPSVNLGGGWWLVQYSFTGTAATYSPRVYSATANGAVSFAGDNGVSGPALYFGKPVLVQRSTALTAEDYTYALSNSDNHTIVSANDGNLAIRTAAGLDLWTPAIPLRERATARRGIVPHDPTRGEHRRETTDATPTDICSIPLREGKTYSFTAEVTAMQWGGTGTSRARYRVEGKVWRDVGGNVTPASTTITISETTGTMDCVAAVNTTAQTLHIRATGIAATRLAWVVNITQWSDTGLAVAA
jgi:trimeric autotransporter adhesin